MLAGGSLFLLFVLLFILSRGIKKNYQELILSQKELDFYQTKVERIEQIRKDYQQLEPDFEKVAGLFVSAEIPLKAIEFWRQIAVSSGLSVKISPFSLPVKNENWDFLGFRIEANGRFGQIMKFLTKTETGPYLSEIQDLTIKKSEKTLEAGFTIKLYVK